MRIHKILDADVIPFSSTLIKITGDAPIHTCPFFFPVSFEVFMLLNATAAHFSQPMKLILTNMREIINENSHFETELA